MIVDIHGERVTPTEAAKLMLLDSAGNAGYWREGHMVDVEQLTPSEDRRISEALIKQYERIQKLFRQEGWTLG